MRIFLLGICAAAALAAACGKGVPLSAANRFDAVAKERETSRTAYADVGSESFSARFSALGSAHMSLDGGKQRANICAVAQTGDVYLANSSSPHVLRWRAGSSRISELQLRPAPERASALAFSSSEGLLYVLDGKRHEVLAYTPSGDLHHMALLNAGQAAASLSLLDQQKLAVGGARWERSDRITLLALHAPDGTLLRALLPLDTAIQHNSVQMSPPLLLSYDHGRLLAAEPTSSRIRLLAGGEVPVGEIDAAYDGYRAPSPLHLSVPTFEAVDGWTRSWDPLVLVHAGTNFIYVAFQNWLPRHKNFRIEVFDRGGRRIATGLRNDARPICGAGDTLVLASSGDPRSVTFTRYADRNAQTGGGR